MSESHTLNMSDGLHFKLKDFSVIFTTDWHLPEREFNKNTLFFGYFFKGNSFVGSNDD